MVASGAMVTDASALAAVAFVESEAAEVGSLLEGGELLAPPLLRAELSNIAWKKCRRHPSVAEQVASQLDWALGVQVRLVHVDYREALQLALLWGLTAYDASYLWVAWSMRAPLVTLDRRLAGSGRDGPVLMRPKAYGTVLSVGLRAGVTQW